MIEAVTVPRPAPPPRRPGPTTGAAFLAVGLLLTACGGDGTGAVDMIPAQLAGTWAAEPACLPQCGFTFVSVENPADSLNVTAFTGLTTEVTLTRDGTFRLRMRPGPDTASTAQVRGGDGILVVTDPMGAVDTLDYVLAGDLLRIAFRRPFVVFDFTGDGVSDPAWVRGALRRR